MELDGRMKNHLAYGVLLATVSLISISSGSLKLKIKDIRPITEPPRSTTQTILAMIQTILWLWLLARLNYLNEKRHQFTRWHFEDLALLKAIKDNAIRLWDNHRPDRKIIRFEEWRGKS
jgi:hypothetical protein